MNDLCWLKQIRPELSIQSILCGYFVHPNMCDCVAVGTSSLRLLIHRSDSISEAGRYDHESKITAAALVNDNRSMVCFISNNFLFFASISFSGISIIKKVEMDFCYSFLVSNGNVLCAYGNLSNIFIYDYKNEESLTLNIDNINLKTKHNDNIRFGIIWSCAFLKDDLIVLEDCGNFQIKIFSLKDRNRITNVSNKILNFSSPYRLIGIPSHNVVYLLEEHKFIKIEKIEEKGYIFSQVDINICDGDPLIVDAAPIGIYLLLLTADGTIIRFDGIKCNVITTMYGAMAISSISISRFLIIIDSSILKLVDRDMNVLYEMNNSICVSSSYTERNFIVASNNAIHSTFIDYGIVIDKYSSFSYIIKPIIVPLTDVFFILYPTKTIILNEDFREITYPPLKNMGFNRINGINYMFFFALTDNKVTVFDHGNVYHFQEKSTLSCNRMYTLFLAEKNKISSLMYCHSTLIHQNEIEFESNIIAMTAYDTFLCISLFNESLVILNDDFEIINKINFPQLITSAIFSNNQLILGSISGDIFFCDSTNLKINDKKTIGVSSVVLNQIQNQIVAYCDSHYFYINEKKTPKILPPDFKYFSPFGLKIGLFLAIVQTSLKSSKFNLILFHFNNNLLGFHSNLLYTINSRVNRVESSKNYPEFVFSIVDPPILVWSRDSVQFNLEKKEKVNSITEWKARLGKSIVQLWVVCTTYDKEGRLLFFSQSRTDNKVRLVLPKLFPSPILGFTIVSSKLAFFVQNEMINGLTLETGALAPKGKATSKYSDIIGIDSSTNYVTVLSSIEGFSIYKIVNDMKLELISIVNMRRLYGRIKIINDFIVVSSRLEPVGYIYEITPKPILVRTFTTISPIVSIFNVYGKALLNCICGEIYLLSCSGNKILDSDVSNLFSFGHSSFFIDYE